MSHDMMAPSIVPVSGKTVVILCLLYVLALTPITPVYSREKCHSVTSARYRYPYCVDGRWGYLAQDGSIAIPPTFATASDFRDGLATVRTQAGPLALIDVDGIVRARLPAAVLRVGSFSEGRAWFLEDGSDYPRYGFLDRNGRVVVRASYDFVRPFSGGLAAVGMGTGAPEDAPRLFARVAWGYIDRNGRKVIDQQYARATSFAHGVAAAKLLGSHHSVVIDTSGRIVTSLETLIHHRRDICTVSRFSHGRAIVTVLALGQHKSSWVGIVLADGTLIWKSQRFDVVRPFADDVAWAREKRTRKYVLLDDKGDRLTDAAYDYTTDFCNGRALVRLSGEWLIIDKKCRVVGRGSQGRIWNDGEAFVGPLARIHIGGELTHSERERSVWWKGGAWYYVDRNGKIVGKCRDSLDEFLWPGFGQELPPARDKD